MERTILKVVIVLALVLGLAAPSFAYTVTEVGDAGELINTSQDTTGGSGALTTITGSLSSTGGANDADLYKIYISDPQNFTATTVTGPRPDPNASVAPDTMLFLFNASGKGLMGDDDVVLYYYIQSKLSKGTSLQPTSPGFYYLAVSTCNNQPLDSNNANIFPGPEASATVVAPDGLSMIAPISSLALSSWDQNVEGSDWQGPYTITLEGVSGVPVPPSVLLLGSGLLGLVGLRRFRKS
jgi:hypothetical protein